MSRLVHQALIREVNARIRELSDRFGTDDGSYILLCECGGKHCRERIEVPASLYEDARASGGFLLSPGHDRPGPAAIVVAARRYALAGASGSRRWDSNPRSSDYKSDALPAELLRRAASRVAVATAEPRASSDAPGPSA